MSTKSLIESLEKYKAIYKKQLDKLSNETLGIMLKDREKELEYARKAIVEVDPQNLTDEYVEIVADGMQDLALMLLEERLGSAN